MVECMKIFEINRRIFTCIGGYCGTCFFFVDVIFYLLYSHFTTHALIGLKLCSLREQRTV
jgi:hypothetical protein